MKLENKMMMIFLRWLYQTLKDNEEEIIEGIAKIRAKLSDPFLKTLNYRYAHSGITVDLPGQSKSDFILWVEEPEYSGCLRINGPAVSFKEDGETFTSFDSKQISKFLGVLRRKIPREHMTDFIGGLVFKLLESEGKDYTGVDCTVDEIISAKENVTRCEDGARRNRFNIILALKEALKEEEITKLFKVINYTDWKKVLPGTDVQLEILDENGSPLLTKMLTA